MALSKEYLIQMLQLRGYSHLRTKLGVKVLAECPENQLNGVYKTGKSCKRADKKVISKDKQYKFSNM